MDINKDDFYSIDDAVQVTWENIPKQLKDKYEIEDIYFIIEQEQAYLDEIGVNLKEGEEYSICDYPIDINEDEMKKYIIRRVVKNDIFLTNDELEAILDAELTYYEMCDALGDMGEYLN